MKFPTCATISQSSRRRRTRLYTNSSMASTRRNLTIRPFKSSGENFAYETVKVDDLLTMNVIFPPPTQRFKSVPEPSRPISRRRSQRKQSELLRISAAPEDASVKVNLENVCKYAKVEACGIFFLFYFKLKQRKLCISLENQ